VLTSLVGVDKLQLRLKSFEVEDAMESSHSLFDMIVNKTLQDLRAQLPQIAGSLAMFGSPIGFARKVGSGVKAFFYEPYLGAVHGSQDFVIGIGKGTSRLISGVVTGAMDSAVAIVDTASNGMSYLSGDADYVRERSLIRQQYRANRAGLFESINNGGEVRKDLISLKYSCAMTEALSLPLSLSLCLSLSLLPSSLSQSVMSGITSGMTGLISKPMEEAAKSGFQGLLKGIGLGLIGAAVKPLIGVTDGLTTVASGILNQVSVSPVYRHIRPPRALEPATMDMARLAIVPLDLTAATAQELVVKRARQYDYDDSFVSYIPLDVVGESIILSSTYLFWWKPRTLWGRVWPNVSHCILMHEAVGIMLYSGEGASTPELVVIPCKSPSCARRVYSKLATNSHRMGNPMSILPLDVALFSPVIEGISPAKSSLSSSSSHTANAEEDLLRQLTAAGEVLMRHGDTCLLGQIEGYRFGSANYTKLKPITGSEEDVLKRGHYFIGNG
jgi:hypothetical protein